MYETYRMLGAEREAELRREAERLQRLPSSRWWACVESTLSSARRLAVRPRRSTVHPQTTAEAAAVVATGRHNEDEWRTIDRR